MIKGGALAHKYPRLTGRIFSVFYAKTRPNDLKAAMRRLDSIAADIRAHHDTRYVIFNADGTYDIDDIAADTDDDLPF